MPIKSGFKAVSELKNLAIKAPPLFLGGGGGQCRWTFSRSLSHPTKCPHLISAQEHHLTLVATYPGNYHII